MFCFIFSILTNLDLAGCHQCMVYATYQRGSRDRPVILSRPCFMYVQTSYHTSQLANNHRSIILGRTVYLRYREKCRRLPHRTLRHHAVNPRHHAFDPAAPQRQVSVVDRPHYICTICVIRKYYSLRLRCCVQRIIEWNNNFFMLS